MLQSPQSKAVLVLTATITVIAIADWRLEPAYTVSALYYVPIVLAAITFDIVGGVVAASAATALFWGLSLHQARGIFPNDVIQIGFFYLIALLFAKINRDHEAIRRMAVTDQLTGVFNRHHLMQRLHGEVIRAQRYHRPLVVMLADVDHFKQVNDTHGHQVGDRVLVDVARRLQDSLRQCDIVARYGGEEFVVLLPEADPDSVAIVGERLRRAVEDANLLEAEGGHGVTVSIGVAVLDDTARSPRELLERADEALYHAKESGRNGACLWRADQPPQRLSTAESVSSPVMEK